MLTFFWCQKLLFTLKLFRFLPMFRYFFCKGWKSLAFDVDLVPGFNWICHYIALLLTTEVKFPVSSFFKGLMFGTVNYTSKHENSKQNVSVKVWFIDEIFNSWTNYLFRTNADKIHESQQYLLIILKWTNKHLNIF